MDVTERIHLANEYRAQVGKLVSGEYKDDTRVLLLIAYTDLVLEHHESIMVLLGKKLYGSAFSLVRVLFEAFFRAHWTTACAKDADIEKLRQQDFEFPGMGTLVSAIDTAFRTDGFFEEIKKQSWKAMNSYTHSGIRQLSRRFEQGRIFPNYSGDEIKEVIDGTTMAVILIGRLFCVIMRKPQEADEAKKLIETFAAS
jgi:hypothetical protein